MLFLRRISYALFGIAVIFTLAGCSSDAPNAVQQESFTTSLPALTKDPIILLQNLDILGMPRARSAKKVTNSTVTVTPAAGGRLTAQLSYTTAAGKNLSVTATLAIPAGAVRRNVAITMSIDTVSVGVRFEPHGLQFERIVNLDYKVTNLDPLSTLLGINLFYIDPFQCEKVECTSLTVNPLKGNIDMKGGQLSHFSQYAFGRRNAE